VADLDTIALRAPVCSEEIGDEASVALLRARLRTEKRKLGTPAIGIQDCRDAAFLHGC
jgi:hypothetical protein